MPSFSSRWRTEIQGSSAANRSAISPVPSGDPSSITRTPSREMSSTSPSARIICSRFSRSLYVGRHTTARGTYISSPGGQDAASERRDRGPARSPGGHLRDSRRGVLQGDRVPARGDADPRDARAGRGAGALGAGDRPARNRPQDGGTDLDGARGHHSRRPEGGGRVGASPRPVRARGAERGEGAEGARGGCRTQGPG